MNFHLANLSPSELRKMHILESKKFNVAIKYGSSVSDLEEIQSYIKEIECILKEKEHVEIPQTRVESIPPYRNLLRHTA